MLPPVFFNIWSRIEAFINKSTFAVYLDMLINIKSDFVIKLLIKTA